MSKSKDEHAPNRTGSGGPAMPGAGDPVTVTPNSRLMENYAIATAASAGSEIVSIARTAGYAELFTVGSDGQVWNYYPDEASSTGFSLAKTGLVGRAIAAGLDAQNRIVVFASQGTTVGYVTEINQPGQRWSLPKTCTVPLPANAISVAEIFCAQIGGHLLVGVLTASQGATPGIVYSLSYADWSAGTRPPTAFNRTAFTISSLHCIWTGSSLSTATFTVIDNIIVGYQIATQSIVRPTVSGTFKTIDVVASQDNAGNDVILGILADGNAYKLIGGGQSPYSWQQLTVAQQYKQVRAVTDVAGLVHGFLLGTDNQLAHLPPSTSSTSGFADPGPIAAPCLQVTAALDDAGMIELFTVGTAQNSVTHMIMQRASGNWQAAPLEVNTGNTPEPYGSYTSDLTFTDQVGSLLVNTPVVIWTTGNAQLTINGSVYIVNVKNPARVTTNDGGVISVAQQTGSLSVPQILVSVPSLMPAGGYVVIDQVANVRDRLAVENGTGLMKATDTDGQPILAGPYRTQDTADAVMTAVNECMKVGQASQARLLGARPAASRSSRSGPHGNGAFHYTGPIERVGRIDPDAAAVNFRLTVVDGHAVYQALAPEEAEAQISLMATYQNVGGIFDWIGSIGDLIQGVADGIVNIISTTVTTIENGVRAVIQFIVDGVNYVYDAIVDTVAKALDVAQAVFAQVKIFFQHIYEWIGFIFNWNDILRTHRALAYTINEFLTFTGLAAGGIQTKIDAALQGFKSQIDTLFEDAIRTIAGTQSLGSYQEDNKANSPAFEAANANNIIYNNLIDNAGSSSFMGTSVDFRAASTGPIDNFIAAFETFLQSTESSPAFAQATAYFTNLGGSPDQVFRQLLAGLMSLAQGLVDTMIDGAQAIIDALIGLFRDLIAIFQASLNAEWKIPFVSDFYSWITNGSKLTTLDLICLIAAIPSTVLYKVIFNAAPFPNQGSLDAFEASFNAQSMVNASGLGPSSQASAVKAQADGWTGLLPKEAALLLATGSAVAGFFSGFLSAICDAVPPPGEAPSVLATTVFVLHIGTTAAAFPWFTSSGPVNCADAAGRGRVRWIYEVIGVLLDSVFHSVKGVPSDVEMGASVVYGIGHLGAGIAASVGQSSGISITNNILVPIPEICKALRLTPIVTATEGISLVVLAGVDALFGTALAVTGFVESLDAINGEDASLMLRATAIPGF